MILTIDLVRLAAHTVVIVAALYFAIGGILATGRYSGEDAVLRWLGVSLLLCIACIPAARVLGWI